ncbi:MAG: xanthine dehydrogenase family protein molybdopterin-binding subunit [Rhizobacter sp.]|nr:xanthine dehydrogenase family protein molybdopterin-binding subunit [Bacteriovorax sp.]
MRENYIGKATNRVDGPLKVTGQAKFAAEFTTSGLLYGVVVSGEIAKGKIDSLDDSEALKVEGVHKVFSHKNRPDIIHYINKKHEDQDSPYGEHFKPFYDEKILFNQQPIALVVAETFEAARHASKLIKIKYSEEPFLTDMQIARLEAKKPDKGKMGWEKPKSRGDAEKSFASAEVKFENEYTTSINTHNPMEMFASTVIYHGPGKLTIYDKTQGVMNSLGYVCNIFDLKKDDVQVLSPYVGGGFGSGLRPQYQLMLATMAALDMKQSVRVVLTRQQMFSFGHRPGSINTFKLGADKSGALTSIYHHVVQETSMFEEYTENIASWSGVAYHCENVDLDHKLAHVNLYTPLDMRAPGAASGMFALECGLDELALKLNMDPIELRLKNFAVNDQAHFHRPHASNELKACYIEGAEKFGWSKRNSKPRSLKDGRKFVGYGMAGGMWEANRQAIQVMAAYNKEGKLTVSSASSDMGTGTYTIMAQMAADSFGLHIDQVKAMIGDSKLPEAPLSGGSWTAASLSHGVIFACDKLKKTLFDSAKGMKNSPLSKSTFEGSVFKEGWVYDKTDLTKKVSLLDILKHEKKDEITETDGENKIMGMIKQMPYSKNTHAAVFVEVKVDEDLGMVEVTKVVSAVAAGKILNPKTARSQILGGVVWGISQALHETNLIDHNFGRIMNHSLAEYHITVQKDVGNIEVIFIDEKDDVTSKMGVKGLGEIGIVGTAAAVANAIYNAIGMRIRELPITPDKLIRAT